MKLKHNSLSKYIESEESFIYKKGLSSTKLEFLDDEINKKFQNISIKEFNDESLNLDSSYTLFNDEISNKNIKTSPGGGKKLKLKKSTSFKVFKTQFDLINTSTSNRPTSPDAKNGEAVFDKKLFSKVGTSHKKNTKSEFNLPTIINKIIQNEVNEDKAGPELKDLIVKENENQIKQETITKRKKLKLKDMFTSAIRKVEENKTTGIEKLIKGSGIFNPVAEKPSDKYFKKDNTSTSKIANTFNEKMNNIDNNSDAEIQLVENQILKKDSLFDGSKSLITMSNKKNSSYYNLNIISDDNENKYDCTTYYIKNNDIEISKKYAQERASNFFGFYLRKMNHAKFTMESEQDMIENVVDFNFLDRDNNYYLIKKINKINSADYFTELVKIYKVEKEEENPTVYYKNLGTYQIKITIQLDTWDGYSGIMIYLLKDHVMINETFVNFEKIIGMISRMNLYSLIPRHLDLNFIKTLKCFTKCIFSHLCFPIKQDEIDSLIVISNPVGVFSFKYYEFDFLGEKCRLDFLILENKNVSLFIYNKSNESLFFQFDILIESPSFDLLFKEYEPNIKAEEVVVPTYTFKDETYLKKRKLIPEIILKIQEIFKNKFNGGKEPKFENVFEHLKNNVMKINIINNLKDVSLWIITPQNNFNWRIDYFTLLKIEINKNFYYIHKFIMLDHRDFYNLIGSDPIDSFKLFSDREIIISNYLLLNSIKLRNINTKSNIIFNLVLTDKNYETMIRLTKISPISIFKMNTTIRHNKHYFIVSLEFLIYSKNNYFMKMIVTESKTCRSYSNIFLPFFWKAESNDLESIKKELETFTNLSKKRIKNIQFKNKVKIIMKEYAMKILTKNMNLNQYSSLESFIGRLNSE